MTTHCSRDSAATMPLVGLFFGVTHVSNPMKVTSGITDCQADQRDHSHRKSEHGYGFTSFMEFLRMQ